MHENDSHSNFPHYIVIIKVPYLHEENTNLQISPGILMEVEKVNHSSHHM